jgi:hypothetical protein
MIKTSIKKSINQPNGAYHIFKGFQMFVTIRIMDEGIQIGILSSLIEEISSKTDNCMSNL